MRLAAAFCLSVLPAIAFAAGGGGSVNKPVSTPTTETCTGVTVWENGTQKCVDPKESSLDQDELGQAVRELAYAGRQEDAQGVLRVMADQESDLVLTYWGFTHRKMGNMAEAKAFYDRAIEKNPDNLLARSYMGQGFVTEGKMKEAKAQLAEIRARGGKGGWPEESLAKAIKSGQTYNY